ncbi:MAG: hypothetical protein WCD11_28310 [Solirubrobacteraceae bacterium]
MVAHLGMDRSGSRDVVDNLLRPVHGELEGSEDRRLAGEPRADRCCDA